MRERILCRGTYRPFEVGDVKFLWAAYRQEGLPQLYFPEGLEIDLFKERVAFVLENYVTAFTIEAEKDGKTMPIAFAAGQIEDAPHYERPHIFPHVTWFPWANSRDRVSGMANFIDGLAKDFLVLAAVRFEERDLFEFLSDAGFGKRIGTPRNWFRKGDTAKLFQTWSE